jgi:hypothetical protein
MMKSKIYRAFLIFLLSLLVGCAGLRSVKRVVIYQPSQECIREYMCRELHFCGPYAYQFIEGNTICYGADSRLGAKSDFKCPDPPLPPRGYCK